MDARFEMRCNEIEKDAWAKAAKQAGFVWRGEANVSGWLRSLGNQTVGLSSNTKGRTRRRRGLASSTAR